MVLPHIFFSFVCDSLFFYYVCVCVCRKGCQRRDKHKVSQKKMLIKIGAYSPALSKFKGSEP